MCHSMIIDVLIAATGVIGYVERKKKIVKLTAETQHVRSSYVRRIIEIL